jgi:hypothetical protein
VGCCTEIYSFCVDTEDVVCVLLRHQGVSASALDTFMLGEEAVIPAACALVWVRTQRFSLCTEYGRIEEGIEYNGLFCAHRLRLHAQ